MEMKKLILIIAGFLTGIVLFTNCNSIGQKDEYVKLTTENFASETATGVVLVDFWATWCMPCKAMAPVIEEIAGQTKGKLKVGKLDIDENPTIANQFGISAIPTLIIFKDGKVVETLVGIQSKASIVSALSKYTTIE